MDLLDVESLATTGARIAVLSVGRYALPVRFRIRKPAVECLVPAWAGVGDLLEGPAEAVLLSIGEVGNHLHWLYMRGPAIVVPEPDWTGFQPPSTGRVSMDDLYQLVRIEPRRIELVDEARGWGWRNTVDL